MENTTIPTLEIDVKIIALANFLELSKEEREDITESFANNYETDGAQYLVLTDEEADEAWEEYMDNYIDDCVLGEIPEFYRQYFDSEKFKRDCSFEGRGPSLAGYDNEEKCETVDGVDYYIYRTN